MSKKRAYVSPKVTRVKMEPTQAVLSQCSVGVTGVSDSNPAGTCTTGHGGGCKMVNHGGDSAATS